MSKLLKILVPVALLVFVVAPGVTGFLVESSIEEAESGYGQLIEAGPFKLVDSNFKRSWFSSEQTMQVSVTDPTINEILTLLAGPNSPQGEVPTVFIETKAAHGVIPLASPAKGGLRPAVAQTESTFNLKFSDGSTQQLPITVYSSLGAGQWARVVADKVDLGDKDEEVYVNWEGADVSVNFGQTSRFDGSLGRVDVRTPEMAMVTTPVNVKGTFSPTEFEFDESMTQVLMDKATLTIRGDNPMEPVVMNNLNASGGIEVTGDRVLVTSNATIGTIDNAFAPVKSLSYSSLYDLDAAAFSAFTKLTQKAQQVDDEMTIEFAEEYMETMTSLITKGGRVSLDDFKLSFEPGTVTMDVNVDLPPGSASMAEALSNGTARGQVVIPTAVISLFSQFAPDIESQLQMASMMGFVEQKDGAYQASLVYENSVLLVNGLPVPLPF